MRCFFKQDEGGVSLGMVVIFFLKDVPNTVSNNFFETIVVCFDVMDALTKWIASCLREMDIYN